MSELFTMRFKLSLELTDKKQNMLPLNYQYELSAWIYQVLHHGSPDFSKWLHDHGFLNARKQFRLFTFSNLAIPERKVMDDRLEILSGMASMVISMLPVETIRNFITGIFRDQLFTLGDRISQVPFRVVAVEAMPEPAFRDTMTFTALSPLLISFKTPEDRYARYLSPSDPEYSILFFRNLKEKQIAFTGKPCDFDEKEGNFKPLSEFRKKGILIKAGTPMQSKLIGYRYEFRITAPLELIRLGYYTGFGEKNSMGFGCAEMKS